MAKANREAEQAEKRRMEWKLKKQREGLDKRMEEAGITREEADEAGKAIIETIFPGMGKVYENIRNNQIKEAEHKNALKNIGAEERRTDERHYAEISKLNAETESIDTETRRKLELVKTIKQIRKNDLASFPVELKYFVIACQAGDPDALSDLMNGAVLKQYLEKKEKAKAEREEHDTYIKQQEARKAKSAADVEEATAKNTLDKMNSAKKI